jgi:hypothetical protein
VWLIAPKAAEGGQSRTGTLEVRPGGAHLADGAVCLQEVGLEERVEQVARHALDGVVDGQHVDALAVLHVSALQP